MRKTKLIPVLLLVLSVLPVPDRAWAQGRPGLFFREDWRETPAALPITQDHVVHPDLDLKMYGAGRDCLKKSHHDVPEDDPYYIWSGRCEGNWAATLRHREAYADLRGAAKIRWRTKQSGFHALRAILKLADGTWLVADQADGTSKDWRLREFNVSDLRWRAFDPETGTEGAWVEGPDLSRVDEIGFTDLRRGGGSQASSRLDWIEIWARVVRR